MSSQGVGLSLSALCWNLTILRDGQRTADQFSGPLSVRLSADLVQNGSTTSNGSVVQSGPEFSSRDKHALLYIIVVLLFYSTGIVIAIVNYLKREKKEIEEEKAYDDYALFRSDPDKMARYFRVQRMITYLNKVEEDKEAAAALKERLRGRSSCPLPTAAVTSSVEHPSKIRVPTRFSVGSDHVIRFPLMHRSHHVVSGGQEVNSDARRSEQSRASLDCSCGDGVSEDGEDEVDRVHSPLRTMVSHV